MKTLIVYASKYGCTEDCANLLMKKLTGDITLVDINKAPKQLDVNVYDTIIIGGSVYVGKVSKTLRAFCESNLDALLEKRVGVFLCSALADQFNDTLKNNFPASLLENAKAVKLFGSEARLEKMRFLDKMLIKAVTKGDFSGFRISNDCIDEFALEIVG